MDSLASKQEKSAAYVNTVNILLSQKVTNKAGTSIVMITVTRKFWLYKLQENLVYLI